MATAETSAVHMTRAHVRAMMCPKQGRGYKVALRVLTESKARQDYFVYLEELRKEQLKAARQRAAAHSIQLTNGSWVD